MGLIMVFTLIGWKNDNIQGFIYGSNRDLIENYESIKWKNFGKKQNQDYQESNYYFNDISELSIIYKNGIEPSLGNIQNKGESL